MPSEKQKKTAARGLLNVCPTPHRYYVMWMGDKWWPLRFSPLVLCHGMPPRHFVCVWRLSIAPLHLLPYFYIGGPSRIVCHHRTSQAVVLFNANPIQQQPNVQEVFFVIYRWVSPNTHKHFIGFTHILSLHLTLMGLPHHSHLHHTTKFLSPFLKHVLTEPLASISIYKVLSLPSMALTCRCLFQNQTAILYYVFRSYDWWFGKNWRQYCDWDELQTLPCPAFANKQCACTKWK